MYALCMYCVACSTATVCAVGLRTDVKSTPCHLVVFLIPRILGVVLFPHCRLVKSDHRLAFLT